MARERTGAPPPEDWEDPLCNYEPRRAPSDPLEAALAEETVSAISSTPYQTIAPNAPVRDAVQALAASSISCLMVADGDQLVGVFSERDVLDKVALEFDRTRDEPVSKYMTANPVYVLDTDSSAVAMCAMALAGYRHIPVLDDDQRIVGIVSPIRVTAFLCDRFGRT